MSIKPDLRLPEYKQKEQINLGKYLLILVLIGYIGFLGFWYWAMEQDLANLENTLKQEQQLQENLTSELDEYQDLQELREKLELKTERLDHLTTGHISWTDHLQGLEDNISTGITLEEYSVQELDSVYISGRSESVLDAMVFIQELEANTAHKNLEIDFISEIGQEEQEENQGETYYFDLYGELDVSAQEFDGLVDDEDDEEEENGEVEDEDEEGDDEFEI